MSVTKDAHIIYTLNGDLLLGENRVSMTVPVTIKHERPAGLITLLFNLLRLFSRRATS